MKVRFKPGFFCRQPSASIRHPSVADFNRDGRADIAPTQTVGQALVWIGNAWETRHAIHQYR
jgi:hypothetical protein